MKVKSSIVQQLEEKRRQARLGGGAGGSCPVPETIVWGFLGWMKKP